MKVRNILGVLSFSFIIFSCASSQKNENIVVEEPVEVIPEVEFVAELTAEELFIESINNVKIEFVQVPKTAGFNRDFSCNYKILVTDGENPLENFPVVFKYPVSKKENEIQFETIQVLTDNSGNAELKQPKLSFGIKDFVYAYPYSELEAPEVLDACLNHSAKADVKVRSDITQKGALLFVWDFNEKNRPLNNSYEILAELRSYGITMAGNAPINESSYIGTPISKLYKENYEIVEDAYGYLLVGTIKFVEPVSQVDDGYKCSLVAQISAVNMKTGTVQLEKSYSHEKVGANWQKCTSKCKEELAAIICEDLIYGL